MVWHKTKLLVEIEVIHQFPDTENAFEIIKMCLKFPAFESVVLIKQKETVELEK